MPADPGHLLSALQANAERRPKPPAVDAASCLADARIVADTVLRATDPLGDLSPSEAAAMSAVAIACARQTFLSRVELTDVELEEGMPVLRHLSLLAESLAVLARNERARENEEPPRWPT